MLQTSTKIARNEHMALNIIQRMKCSAESLSEKKPEALLNLETHRERTNYSRVFLYFN